MEPARFCLPPSPATSSSLSRGRPEPVLDKSISGRLAELEARYEDVQKQLSDPSVGSDPDRLRELGKLNAELEATVVAFRQLKEAEHDLESAKQMLNGEADPEMRELA
ncbi:MAG: PCRF domain-containing protein, partial [Actinomycetota bacterium]